MCETVDSSSIAGITAESFDLADVSHNVRPFFDSPDDTTPIVIRRVRLRVFPHETHLFAQYQHAPPEEDTQNVRVVFDSAVSRIYFLMKFERDWNGSGINVNGRNKIRICQGDFFNSKSRLASSRFPLSGLARATILE